MLDVADLHVYGAGRALLSGIDLSCAPGERVAVVGASGSGKA